MVMLLHVFLIVLIANIAAANSPPLDEPACPFNEHYVVNSNRCIPTCGNRLTVNSATAGACVPYTGCICDDGHVRQYDNATGPCIPESKCAPIPTNCPDNEEPSSCAIVCPPQTCESINTSYDCPQRECEPGCNCINNYLRKNGTCIPSEKCSEDTTSPQPPKCGQNEVATDCARVCPPQSCDSQYLNYLCAIGNCSAGCNCIDGFLRNADNVCIPSSLCPPSPYMPIPIDGSPISPIRLRRPPVRRCKDRNAVFKKCPSPCALTCNQPKPRPCSAVCLKEGCECKPGFVLDKIGGTCIRLEQCKEGNPTCPGNKTYVHCRVGCPTNYCPKDDRQARVICDPPRPCPSGCVCKAGYLMLSEIDDTCIDSSECPPVKCTRPNEEWNPRPPSCRAERCEDLGQDMAMCVHSSPYDRPTCLCKPGFYRNQSDICVPASKCPCKGDPNAVMSTCPTACPATCKDPRTKKICTKNCLKPGCVCKSGYVLDETSGKCVLARDCPGGNPTCPGNKTYVNCKVGCPTDYCPKDDRQGQVACDPPQPCPSGCVCKAGYLMLSETDDTCIDSSECPPVKCTRPNEEWNPRPPSCRAERCEDLGQDLAMCVHSNPYDRPTCLCKPGFYRNQSNVCVAASECLQCEKKNAVYSECPSACQATCSDPDIIRECMQVCMSPNCVCKKGYVLDEVSGSCVLRKNCPACKGDQNAVMSNCPTPCPATCKDPSTNKICTKNCLEPGCVCKSGYVLDEASGKCVLARDCPACKGDPNAVMSNCPTPCPATCKDPSTNKICTRNCLEPGCVCKSGYVLDEASGKCVLARDCPAVTGQCQDPNASWRECTTACPPTCNNRYIQTFCIAMCMEPGCQCNPGYYLDDQGKCVLPEQCPTCNGDYNATASVCASPCAATCADPDSNKVCIASCAESGCACKSGFIHTKVGGKCIVPEDCPGGSPICPANETYAQCKIGCPTNYCPVDDTRAIPQCSPQNPCPSGCVCQGGNLRRNDNQQCVPPTDCPPVTCTRPNEEFNTNPPNCLADRCEDRYGNSTDCPVFWPNGRPACVCKKGFYRNSNDTCVPESECPCKGDPNAVMSNCPTPCPATCKDPSTNKICTRNCLEPGCVCKSGYVLDEASGKCVLARDCPAVTGQCQDPNASWRECTTACPPTCNTRYIQTFCIAMCMEPGCQCNPGYYLDDQGKCVLPEQCPTCNGDYNATSSVCASPCAATCADPDSNKVCIASCAESGCACKSGFIHTKVGGKCIVPEDCPGGSPTCPANETYVQCKIGCPTNYCPVDDTRAIPQCSPQNPCPSGCVCQGGNLRRNDNQQCVPRSECPPVTCTRPNEEFNTNPPNCLADRCEDRYGNSTDCPVFWPKGRPACICKKGFYRNSNDTCVPESECPQICNVPAECRRTCASPNPPNCPYNPPESNQDGCDCQEGYILSDINGKCVPIQECPSDQPCNGDPHARPKRCPYPCPGTCDAPEAAPCKKMCEPIGCECEQGYIFNKDGKCILPDECPGGNPCGKNSYYAFCRFGCGQDYCPTDDNRGIILCKPPRDCLPGCRCNINHRWISYENRTCIESASCPPVECTRQNEVWDGCPSDCLAEMCEDVNNPYTACNTLLLNCQPKCVCKKGHFRNKDDLCVPANECCEYDLLT